MVTGPRLAVRTCARRLAPLGLRPAQRDRSGAHGGSGERLLLTDGSGGQGPPLEIDVSWFGPAALGGRPGSEAVVQALSGLMALHGRDADRPRRLGLEVASVGAGILAAHAVAAVAIGRRRGVRATAVDTSVLGAGLLVGSHRIAAATAGDPWVPAPPGPDPGPPFRSADGHCFEIETLDQMAWREFWDRLGAGDADLQWAWNVFRPRYFRGTCRLPEGLHAATAARPLEEIAAAAEACSVSLCRVRSYDEVLEDVERRWGRSAGGPAVSPLAGPAPDRPGTGVAPEDGDGPLAGLRVVEATSRMQGPLASLLLQMLGAEVLRVEPPIGAFTRDVPPLVEGVGSFFRCFNRGKETVQLDLAREAGRDALRDAVADADVFLQNWRPGKAAEWSLTAGDLAAVNPRLVYTWASGWGEDPDLSRLIGTDFLVQAHAGVGAGLTEDGRPPAPSRVLLTDHVGALVTAEAMLVGLHRRQATGRGQRMGASLLGGAMALQDHVLEALEAGQEKGRRCGRPVWGTLDRPLPTADGFLAVTVRDDGALERLADACGVRRGGSNDGPPVDAIADRIAEDGAVRWEERLAAAGVPCAAVRTDVATLADDDRLTGLLEPLGGSALVPAAPWRVRS